MTKTREREAPEGRIERYEPKNIEPKWRERWEADQIYKTVEDPSKPKFYCLDFFPYPSGDGLSVGHVRNYVPTDVISRFYRMRGYSVLHPMGWDAFGQPAEQEAIKTGRHPKQMVPQYTANYHRQLELVGNSYDWSREINSSHPDYYKWTQWFFLLLYKRGLAYRDNAAVWWCPKELTVLANEEVEGGVCWRCGTAVVKKDLPQWFFKITGYADRLIEDLEIIDWPERIKTMQRNWIGRSEGVEIAFGLDVSGVDEKELRVFTTRPDTIFGVTFMVLAPEHPLVSKITTSDRKTEVEAYVEQATRQSEIDRLSTEREKTGVFTGSFTDMALARSTAESQFQEDCDAILPVGGAINLPAGDAINDLGLDAALIGVDVDAYFAMPEQYQGLWMVTIEKAISPFVTLAVSDQANGTWAPGAFVGDLANDGVGLSDFHDWADRVSDELAAEVDQLLADIEAGIIGGPFYTVGY